VLGIGNIAGRIQYGAQIVAQFKHKIQPGKNAQQQGAVSG